MDSLLEGIGEWIRQGLISGIMTVLQTMFDLVNMQVGVAAVQAGATPESWNSGVFSMIRTLSETVITPIAGIILTFVLCYELIQLIIEKNNMHDFDTFNIFKWIFKTFCATYILTNTFNIVMAVFALAQQAVSYSAGLITGNLDIGGAMSMAAFEAELQAMSVWEMLGLYMETSIIGLCMGAMSVCIFIVVFGRMIEIYLVVSVAPIPFSTMVNREWGQMGTNYLKSLFALAFQGFLIMVCIAIYAVLIATIVVADSIHIAIWTLAGYTLLLCFTLFKTGGMAKSLFSAH